MAAYNILRAFSWQIRLSPFAFEELCAALFNPNPSPLMDELHVRYTKPQPQPTHNHNPTPKYDHPDGKTAYELYASYTHAGSVFVHTWVLLFVHVVTVEVNRKLRLASHALCAWSLTCTMVGTSCACKRRTCSIGHCPVPTTTLFCLLSNQSQAANNCHMQCTIMNTYLSFVCHIQRNMASMQTSGALEFLQQRSLL